MSQVKRNITANLLSKGWIALLSLALVPYYIKFIGIEAYGLIGFFTALQSVFYLLDLGLSTAINREVARLSTQPDKAQETRDLVRTLEIVQWAIAGLIGLAVCVLSPLIGKYWLNPKELSGEVVRQALFLIGLVMACQFPYSFYSGGLLGLQKQVLQSGLDMAVMTLRGVGAILILWLISPTIQAFLLWQIVVTLTQTLLGGYFLWRSLPPAGAAPRFRKTLLSDIWKFAAGIAGISVVALLLTQADKILLSKLLTLKMFGYYSLATVVAGSLRLLIGPITNAVFPRFSQLVSIGDEETLVSLYHRSCQFLSVLILPIAAVIAVFAPQILLLWTHDPLLVENTHLLVSLLIAGTALHGLMHIPYVLQLAHGWTKLALYQNAIAVILLVPLMFWAAIHYGAVGAAAIWIILNLGYVLIGIHVMHTRLIKSEKWRWYAEDVGFPLFAAASVTLTMRWISPLQDTPLLSACWIMITLALSMVAAALSAPYTRSWIRSKYSNRALFALKRQ